MMGHNRALFVKYQNVQTADIFLQLCAAYAKYGCVKPPAKKSAAIRHSAGLKTNSGDIPQPSYFTAFLRKGQVCCQTLSVASLRQTFTPARATAKTNQKMTITRG